MGGGGFALALTPLLPFIVLSSSIGAGGVDVSVGVDGGPWVAAAASAACFSRSATEGVGGGGPRSVEYAVGGRPTGAGRFI